MCGMLYTYIICFEQTFRQATLSRMLRKTTQPKEEQQNHEQSKGDIVLQSEGQKPGN
jgi:hypothetical protein